MEVPSDHDDGHVRLADTTNKEQGREHADKHHGAVHSVIKPGNKVLLQQPKHNKLSTTFESKPYIVFERKGNCVVLARHGKRIQCNVSHVKQWVEALLPRETHRKDDVDFWDRPDEHGQEGQTAEIAGHQEPRPSRVRHAPAHLKDYVR
ncbi:hypothetical protein EOD39_14364 [Acipenser ruthenus]|uniref:Uncharacterized protein n=1 Tax=Acipenser ruthenus TaxID=7906 RepID=A0A662YPS2_ACIRT|nr:hypothetical protein EOD39_14364 [Acipenser ruthenus]